MKTPRVFFLSLLALSALTLASCTVDDFRSNAEYAAARTYEPRYNNWYDKNLTYRDHYDRIHGPLYLYSQHYEDHDPSYVSRVDNRRFYITGAPLDD